MPQETKSIHPSPGDPAAPESGEKPTLQGLVATREDEQALLGALEKAFDYRGDVTLELIGGRTLRGYIFDHRKGATLAASSVRLLPEDSDQKITVTFDTIARVEFTGKDTAAGKSYETWLKKYVEKKLKGEKASIESEPL
ncbi:MAG: hypothetical protein SFZ24_08070 [Planctomycetota bacterium]|nr:hypothetical protein [Planctomycetota bacterium]